jgi:hypothetical protein
LVFHVIKLSLEQFLKLLLAMVVEVDKTKSNISIFDLKRLFFYDLLNKPPLIGVEVKLAVQNSLVFAVGMECCANHSPVIN